MGLWPEAKGARGGRTWDDIGQGRQIDSTSVIFEAWQARVALASS